jgi:hypothetical protein
MLFMLRVPSYPWLEDKALLRAAMQGQLPDTVCTRPKTTLRQITGKYSREQQRRQMHWMSALVKQPELAAYLDQTAVLAYLHEQTLSLQTIRPILPVLQLAY